MRERAIIYTRVSTDEQNNGYSPIDQKEKLYRYCESRNIDVIGFYHDDETGKTFNRPQWKKIKAFLKSNKNLVNYIYFLKWDRFSRNATDAYAELADLKKLNVEARAMEQPLDLSIPEQKLLLALYLTAPEVDNDRRSLNIFHGIRRAKKDGRLFGNVPYGYKKSINQFNRPVVVPEGGKKEQNVREAFEMFATGLHSTEDLRIHMRTKGLNMSRNGFAEMLKKKLYLGLVYVRPYKNEPEEWVQGHHGAIIDEELFQRCQDVFDSRRRKAKQSFKLDRDEFPLRGHLVCPKCARMLTASSSKGRNGYYPYYHCNSECGERHSALEVNSSFVELLESLEFKPKRLKLLKKMIEQAVLKDKMQSKQELDEINKKMSKQHQRSMNAKGLMLDGEITAAEYREIKKDIENTISNLSRQLSKFSRSIENIEVKVSKTFELVANIAKLYQQSDVTTKKRLIGSLFPKNLIYDKNISRTTIINGVVALSINDTGASGDMEKGKHANFGVLTSQVESEGVEPHR